MDNKEHYRLPEAQTREQQAKVEQVVEAHDRHLRHRVLCFPLQQEADAKDQ